MIRSFDSERALKICRNIGKKKISVIVITPKKTFVVKVYLFDEEEGTRTSWDLWSPLEYRSPRRGMTQLGSDGVAEPV